MVKRAKYGKMFSKGFFKNKWNIIFLLILLLVVIFVIFGGFFIKHPSDKPVSKSSVTYLRFMKPGFASHTKTVSGSLSYIQSNVDGSIKYIPPTNGAKFGTLQGDNGIITSSIFNNINPTKTFWTITYKNPNFISTPLGTDSIGTSVFARLIVSSRFSIGLAISVTLVESIIGTIIGIYLGYNVGKWLDTYFMRIIEIFISIPALLMVTIFVMLLGRSFTPLFFALILIGWTGPVFVARMFTIKVKDLEFINVSRSIGSSRRQIIYRHILPSVLSRIIVSFVHRIPSVIFIEAVLVFLGIKIGGEAQNTLGNMLEQSRTIEAITANPWFLISTVSVVLLFTLSLQILANGLRDALDSKVSS
ncbi:ABC transporter permease [Mycoplasma marinum]|uniref:ABC transporter permease n=1 Tax=Mycoplasma marinum TaxID=1937190 RepID=UPI003B3408D8